MDIIITVKNSIILPEMILITTVIGTIIGESLCGTLIEEAGRGAPIIEKETGREDITGDAIAIEIITGLEEDQEVMTQDGRGMIEKVVTKTDIVVKMIGTVIVREVQTVLSLGPADLKSSDTKANLLITPL